VREAAAACHDSTSSEAFVDGAAGERAALLDLVFVSKGAEPF
jgi:hypothetical protein